MHYNIIAYGRRSMTRTVYTFEMQHVVINHTYIFRDGSLWISTSTHTFAVPSLHLQDSNTRHALTLRFPHPRWPNKHGRNRKSKSPFIALPFVVLAVLTLVPTNLCSSLVVSYPQAKKWRVENYFMLKKILWGSINHEIFLTPTFSKMKYFLWKICRLQYVVARKKKKWRKNLDKIEIFMFGFSEFAKG